MTLVIKDDNRMISMNNNLAEAKYSLSLQEQKLYLYAISLIPREDRDRVQDQEKDKNYFTEIKFKLKDFAKESNMDLKQLYKDIQTYCKNLMGVVITIRLENNEWDMYHLMQKCKYRSGELIIKFDDEMMPFLLDLKKYSSHLLTPIKFRNKYAIRIYQILRTHAYKKGQIIEEYDLKEFREMIGLDKKQYTGFKDLRVRVLEKAKGEINKTSDIKIEYEKITHGKKVTGLKFIIENQIIDEEKELYNELYTKEFIASLKDQAGIKDENFDKKQVIDIYEIADKKIKNVEGLTPAMYIKANYQYMRTKDTVRNRYAYLLKCLDDDLAKCVDMYLMFNAMKN